MNIEYNEPVLKVVITSSQDVITTSETPTNYTPGTFETDAIPLE